MSPGERIVCHGLLLSFLVLSGSERDEHVEHVELVELVRLRTGSGDVTARQSPQATRSDDHADISSKPPHVLACYTTTNAHIAP